MTVSIANVIGGEATGVGHTTIAATFPNPTTAGRTLVLAVGVPTFISVTTPSGWTDRTSDPARLRVFTKVASGSETTVTVTHGSTNRSAIFMGELSANASYHSIAVQATENQLTHPIPAVSPPIGAEVLLLAINKVESAFNKAGQPSGYTLIAEQVVLPGGVSIRMPEWSRSLVATTAYSATAGYVAAVSGDAAHVVFSEVIPFVADFEADVRAADSAPLSVDFTDLSDGGTGTVDTWAWTFGDGGTSTSQNPTHIYTQPGSYTVTLTAETDDAETDTETKVKYIVIGDQYVAPEPGGAILEIYTSLPGAPRWNVARWGQEVWNSAGWVDVTPQGITVQIRWGSHQPERGILAETEAATWLVTTYDPDRLLDPGNEDSPYHTDLVAGLPIRLRHRGVVIRQGYAERIAFFHADEQGAIRATDNVSLMARTPVPADSIVADTLYARARDVISAAGLRITVAPDPPSGDPALAPRLDGDRSVWRHVADAAEQVLHIPYVDRIGTLHFRPWADPYDRGRGVDETNLVDLGTQIDAAGLFSVVQARDEITEDIVERALTPTPKYGRVTYTRDELTPDADAWADAVLADRSLQTVQWIPGMIWPLTADDVEYFATLEAIERFGVRHLATDPVVDISGIIVGGEINVKGKKDSNALWSFELELSQTASQPLIDDVDGEFLLNETEDAYLYAG